MAPPPKQGGGGTRAPALTYVSAGAGVVVHVVVPGRGGFTVYYCLYPQETHIYPRHNDSILPQRHVYSTNNKKTTDQKTQRLCEILFPHSS